MSKPYTPINECLCCGGATSQYLDLGDQPLANVYHKSGRQPVYPLAVGVCQNCWHSQLTVSVDPHLMFDNYFYVSGTSETFRTYLADVKDNILATFKAKPSVLELGCNDGTFLKMFADAGCDCLGIDPAKSLKPVAEAKGLKVLDEYWSLISAYRMNRRFDVVLAVNVLPHVPHPLEFLMACRTVLAPGGRMYVQTSQCDMLKNGEWDTIYHEHCSFFTAHSFSSLAAAAGLNIRSVSKEPVHGMSFLWELTHGDGSPHLSLNLDNMLREEREAGMTTLKFYEEWGNAADQKAVELKENLERMRGMGHMKIVGYGAAAKGNTALNFINEKLDYIVDDDPAKWGYLTPGQGVPIVPPQVLAAERGPICIVPLAWNFLTEIKARVRQIAPAVKPVYLKYFPKVIFE